MQVNLANLIAAQSLRAQQPAAAARPTPPAQTVVALSPGNGGASPAAATAREDAPESRGPIRPGSKIDIRV